MDIRKINTFVEDVLAEGGRKTETPLRKVAVVAVVENRYAGKWVEDLSEYMDESEAVGRLILDEGDGQLSSPAIDSRAGILYFPFWLINQSEK